MINRKKTRQIKVRGIPIGGGAPVVIQSMVNRPVKNTDSVLIQIEELQTAGCRIVRIAVPNKRALDSFSILRKKTDVPLVADIHFQYELAVESIKRGADKVRINPGNIGSRKNVENIVTAAKEYGIPLRIGVNAGSLEKEILQKHGSPSAEALFESASLYCSMMKEFDFDDYIVSIKASNVLTTIEACRILSRNHDCPQHIGITEAGTRRGGTIRSAVGLGALLSEGIGDTIRVSLAGSPVDEIYAAREILKSLDLAEGPVVIACPTCGRTQIDVEAIALEVENRVSGMNIPVKIAVMGCIVNGPGEAAEADIGIAGGRGEGKIFVKGKPVKKVKENDMVDELISYLDKYKKNF